MAKVPCLAVRVGLAALVTSTLRQSRYFSVRQVQLKDIQTSSLISLCLMCLGNCGFQCDNMCSTSDGAERLLQVQVLAKMVRFV